MTDTTVKLGGDVTIDGPRGRVYENILETVASTPLVRASKFAKAQGIKADLLLKCEFFNPLASVKDRIALNIILKLEESGKLKPGGTIVETTSGNTGIGLAFVAASRGYRLIVTMPDSMSIERRKMLKYLGAELALTPKEEGIAGAFAKAEELAASIDGAILAEQFTNAANPDIHDKTTALEIWADTGGKVDGVISGVGTGGTMTGIGRTLKQKKSTLKMYAVEPEDSPVLSGGEGGPHMIQGIGTGFIPENADTSQIDEVVQISNEAAFATARLLAELEGIPAGISSGAALAAATKVGSRDDMAGKTLVVILPSFAERYLSTALFEGI